MNEQAIILRRASRAPSSWDAQARTFTAVLSTGAAVSRVDMRGPYEEVLNLAQQYPAHVPLLDGHRRDSVEAVIGEIKNIRVERGELIGTATLSAHSAIAQRVAAELSDGQTFGVSIGYRVARWLETKTADGKRAKVADKFDLVEASLVPIAADDAAGIRSGETAMNDTVTTTQDDAARAAIEARAQVNASIRSIAEIAGLDRAFADQQIDAGATVEEARAAAFTAMQARSRATQTVRTTATQETFDNPEFRRAAMADAIYVRINPAHKPSDPARQFVGLSMVEMARALLQSANIQTMGFSPGKVVERAMTTSDFPLLLGDVMNKELRTAYGAAPSGLRRVARATTARNFRAKHKIQVSGPLTLEPVGEHGEFRSGTFAEGKEAYALSTFGRIVAFSRQAIVNDDLGGLADPARHLGRAAAEQEAAALAALLASNPVMSDTKALFATEHGNIAGSGAAISDETLSAARLALRTQKGLSGEPISVTPRYVVVGPAIETAAEKALSAIQATQTDNANPFAALSLVVEPRISGNGWHVVADPAEIDGLEFAHLEGEQGPQVISEMGFDVDAVRFRIRNDFGCGFVDWCGWYRNAGA